MLMLTIGANNVLAQNLISPSQAISIATQQYNGKVISTELKRPSDGPPYYQIKMISNDGKVRVVRVDAVRD